jgi:hypothetical protein
VRSLSLVPIPSLVALATVLGLAAGCPSYTRIADGSMKVIRDERERSVMWLKQSMYAGDFWDDGRYRLLSARPFEQISYLRTPEGEPLPPPRANDIVEAGTRVTIKRIAFPTGDAVFRRPIYTPRFTTWVYLHVGQARGSDDITHDKEHILLLPAYLNTKERFDDWFGASLTEVDPNEWIRSLPAEQRRGIDTKRAVVGMGYEALSKEAREGAEETIEVAIFGATSVILEDGVVTKVSDPQP